MADTRLTPHRPRALDGAVVLLGAMSLLGACAGEPAAGPQGGEPPDADPAPRADTAAPADTPPPADTPGAGAGHDAGTRDRPALPPPGAMRACLENPDCDDVYVVAHRGLRREGVPENSLAALDAAAEAGIPMAEIDLRTTQDGVVVLMHDTTVQRTTDGRGEVRDLTWARVQGLTLRGGNAASPDATRVPTFDEALARAADLGLALYLDIKDAPADVVVAAVREAGMMDQALFRRGVGALVDLRTQSADAWLLAPVGSVEEAEEARARLAPLTLVEVGGIQPQPGLTAALQAEGFRVQQDVFVLGDAAWTLQGDPTGWDGFLEAGVQVLQSDAPEALQQAVTAWQAGR